ncbi:MAG: hypothetical protein ABEH43_00265, partial [Flavobacteriales bacterium]
MSTTKQVNFPTKKELKEKAEKKLNKKELSLFRKMLPQSGVLFLWGQPGIAKSAITETIAKKLDIQYIEVRVSLVEETELGLFPNKIPYTITNEDGSKTEITTMEYCIAEWALMANEKPTIIHFEEVNVADSFKMNACMQIMLDRKIGYKFKFKDTVFMVASGNLGEEDGNPDVQEMKSALRNRMIHHTFTLSFKEWKNQFGKKNVHPSIIDFFDNGHDDKILSKIDNDGENSSKAFATYRSWTQLSDFIVENFGMDSSPNEWLNTVEKE